MTKKENWNSELSEYIKQGEPNKSEKAKNWETAIGLQDVDGLKTSKYLLDTAKEHIEGDIDINEVKKRIDEYYIVSDKRKQEERESSEEADKVAARITELLSENAFNFSIIELTNIHSRLFKGIYDEAGQIRDYNFSKKEWVLDDDTVIYSSYETIKENLEYDLDQERNFSYKDLSLEESIKHIAKFTSNIWQTHPFCEGNTRTTAVFIIKYLKTFGFDINCDLYAENSWYFRNALVRANYRNFQKNVFEDISFLEKFFFNLLSDTNYELKNRYMHIDYSQDDSKNTLSSINYSFEEQIIINIIKKNESIKQEEIASLIGKSVRTVKTIMKRMQEKGIIKRMNSKRDSKWIVL